MTPYYSEETVYSKNDLDLENEDGVSIIFYLQKIFPGFESYFLGAHHYDLFSFNLVILKLDFHLNEFYYGLIVLSGVWQMNGTTSWKESIVKGRVKSGEMRRISCNFVIGPPREGRHFVGQVASCYLSANCVFQMNICCCYMTILVVQLGAWCTTAEL